MRGFDGLEWRSAEYDGRLVKRQQAVGAGGGGCLGWASQGSAVENAWAWMGEVMGEVMGEMMGEMLGEMLVVRMGVGVGVGVGVVEVVTSGHAGMDGWGWGAQWICEACRDREVCENNNNSNSRSKEMQPPPGLSAVLCPGCPLPWLAPPLIPPNTAHICHVARRSARFASVDTSPQVLETWRPWESNSAARYSVQVPLSSNPAKRRGHRYMSLPASSLHFSGTFLSPPVYSTRGSGTISTRHESLSDTITKTRTVSFFPRRVLEFLSR